MRYLLLTSYDGTDFSGWQIQPGKRTVQGTVREAAARIFGGDVLPVASGRTDSGVHALGQVVCLDGVTGIPPEKLAACFNRLLPPDVRVLKSCAAPEDFDCTRGARKKTYLYRAYFADAEMPLLSRYAARLPQRPDVARMRAAAELLIGTHDFAAFRSSGYTSKTSERTIYAVEVAEREIMFGNAYEITVAGNGFLYNMVRILAGELFAVGCGKEQKISRAFETGARKDLARTMPPQGLVLLKVEYGVPLFGTKES